MSKLEVRSVTNLDGETDLELGKSGGTVTLADGATAVGFGGGGKLLQVVQVVKSDIFSSLSTTMIAVPGLSASITPSSATNKILVNIGLALASSKFSFWSLRRDGVEIAPLNTDAGYISGWGLGAHTSDQMSLESLTYLDSPSSNSSITYSVAVSSESTREVYVNRTPNDLVNQNCRGSSYITLMEVAG